MTYLTEGQLRAIHRHEVASSTSLECGGLAPLSSRSSTFDNKAAPGRRTPKRCLVPQHTFLKKDAMPLVPGEVTELRFGLQPISVVVKKGHRLRVAIAGHDKDTFIRVPAEGTPSIAVQRNKQHLSSIELPIIKR